MDISQKKKQIHFTELKRVNKLKCPSEEASVPLGREKKAITNGRDLGGRVDRRGEEKGT